MLKSLKYGVCPLRGGNQKAVLRSVIGNRTHNGISVQKQPRHRMGQHHYNPNVSPFPDPMTTAEWIVLAICIAAIAMLTPRMGGEAKLIIT
jgi:hypothetical protein